MKNIFLCLSLLIFNATFASEESRAFKEVSNDAFTVAKISALTYLAGISVEQQGVEVEAKSRHYAVSTHSNSPYILANEVDSWNPQKHGIIRVPVTVAIHDLRISIIDEMKPIFVELKQKGITPERRVALLTQLDGLNNKLDQIDKNILSNVQTEYGRRVYKLWPHSGDSKRAQLSQLIRDGIVKTEGGVHIEHSALAADRLRSRGKMLQTIGGGVKNASISGIVGGVAVGVYYGNESNRARVSSSSQYDVKQNLPKAKGLND